MDKALTATCATLISLLLAGGGCASGPGEKNDPAGRTIYRVGTADYDRKVASFSIKPREAQARLGEYLRSQNENYPGGFAGDHEVIVNDEYVFTPPDKLRNSLDGWYVSGHTGAVRDVDTVERFDRAK